MLFFLLIAAALARVPLEDVLSGEAESDLSTMLNSLLRQDVEAEMSDSMEDDSAEAFDNEDDSAEAFDEDESSDPEDELSGKFSCGMVKDRLSGCSSGERKITYKEMGMCKDHLCNNLISTWAIVNVDGGHMDGKGYGCKYDTNVRRTGHELCVADTSSGWVHCATEHRGESCACDGTVRYGHGTTWNEKTSSGSIACNNGVFGDPKPGYTKTCECMQTGTDTLPECPAGYTQVGTLTTKNDVAGVGLGQVRMAKIEDCKAKCDRDSRCKSFGFGHHNSKTFTECEIDGVDTPNQNWSPHGPLRMCKKTCPMKYTKKWPHCENIDCNRRDFKSMVQVCAQHKDCNGFSYDGSWGCLKKNCVNNGKNGMGSGTHDYYECRSEGIAPAVEAALSFDDNVEEQLLAELINRLAAKN